MHFGFGFLCLSCKTPFVSADQGSTSKLSQIKCSSILARLPGVSETSAQLEMSQESLHITAVHLPGEGSQLLTMKGSPFFLPGPLVGCVKPCNHGQKKCSSTMHDLSWYLPRIPLTSQLFYFKILGRSSALKPVPLETTLPALRPQTDVMLTLVLDFLCQEQLVLCEAIVL